MKFQKDHVRVSMDACEILKKGKKRRYLITVDYYSDFFEIDELTDLSARVLVEICKKNFSRHGIPDCVITDNSTQFVNENLKNMAHKWNFNHITSSPHYPKGNGKAEATVKISKNLLKKAIDAEDFWLSLSSSRRTRCVIPQTEVMLTPKVQEGVNEKIGLKRRTSKYYYDRKARRRLPKLNVGQNVIVRVRPETDNKWAEGQIKENLSDRSFLVGVGDSVYRRNTQHVKPVPEIAQSATPQLQTSDATSSVKPRNSNRVTFAEFVKEKEIPPVFQVKDVIQEY